MLVRFYKFLFFFLMCSSWLFSQSDKIDSLKTELNKDIQDSNYINTLNQLIGEVRFHDGEKALELCENGIRIATKIDFQRGLMLMHYNKGVAYYTLGEFSSAIEPVEKALDFALITNRKINVSACYNVLGVLYQNLDQTDKAIKYLFKSLELGKEMKDSFAMLHAYVNIGTQYFDKNNMKSALEFFLEAEKLGIALQDPVTLGTIYLNLSNVNIEDSVKLVYLNKASLFADSLNDPYTLSYINQAFGGIHLDNNNYAKAYQYYSKAFVQAKQLNNQFLMTKIGSNIAKTMMYLDQYDSAKIYLDTSIVLAEKNDYVEELGNNYFYMSKWYRHHGDFESSLYYLELENEIMDTLFSGTINEKLAEANAKFQNVEREKEIASQQLEIERQKNQKKTLFFFSILALLLATTVFIWYYYRSQRKKREAELALKIEHAETIKLRELDEMKTQFFTNISHELRTPLTLIIGPLEKALENLMLNKGSDDIKLAHKNSKKLLGLVNEIMDLSKLESGKLKLNNQSTEIKPLIRRIFYSFKSFTRIQDIKLLIDFKIQDGVQMDIDVEKFEKILNNLMSNAIKLSNKGSKIEMVVSDDNNNIFVSVKDEGVGIKEDELEKVFDRYYQSQSEGQALRGGTGVGLALSKQLALLLGGDLKVKSQINEGAKFTLSIPKHGWKIVDVTVQFPQEVEDENQDIIKYIPLLINGEQPHILIVEDNLDMSRYLKSLLSSEYNCTMANDGMEALKLVQTKHFDLITSDVMMPHMDGFKFREKVNSLSEIKQIPFVFLTARSLEEDKLLGLQLGVDDFITKPFSAKELMARIYNLLSNKRERDHWLRENSSEEMESEMMDNNETQLLKDAERLVIKNLSNSNFKVNDLAIHLNYGERQLRRIIKKLTGLSPVNFVLEIRLLKAYQLLENRQFLTISEVRYEVGIESASYFTSKFKIRFGRSPKEVLNG